MLGNHMLEPRHDGRKSFYGKARVEINPMTGEKMLISYTTVVARIRGNTAIVHGTYSQTTLRHIKEFLRQNGFRATSKSQIMRDYGV